MFRPINTNVYVFSKILLNKKEIVDMNCGIILIETHLNDEEFLAYAGSEYILSRLINILKFSE